MESVECAVIGAGVIGLAAARALAAAGMETLLLERNGGIGMETSSRNSEVIHAGLHYPAGSLKAVTCVRGRELLYDYCERQGVPHKRCGKLIVATDESQLPELAKVHELGQRNGVSNLRWLDGDEAQQLEPQLHCVGALHSPSTGILDTAGYMLSLLGDAEHDGAVLVLRTPVSRLQPVRSCIHVQCEDSARTTICARWVVNAAGLGAVELGRRTEGYPQERLPRAYLAKGNYFSLAMATPFSHLVYPIPEPGGLGVHLTLDLAGQARFGPDVEWIDAIDYAVDPRRAAKFYAAIRSYWPGLRDGALQAAYAGIRPKIAGPGEPAADFRIDGPAEHGIPGLIQLMGIESPGLTASLAIAERILATIRSG